MSNRGVLMETVLGINIGTTSTEGCLVNVRSGKLVSQCSVGYSPGFYNPDGVKNGAEQGSQVWTDAAIRAANEMVLAGNNLDAEVRAIAISSMIGGLNIPVDRDFEPLRQVPIWIDRRAHVEAKAASEALDTEQLGKVTGNVDITPSMGFTKLLWYMANDTDRFRRTRALMTPNGMLVKMLTGEHATDSVSLGAFGGVMDRSRMKVDDDLLFQMGEIGSKLAGERLELSPELFGKIIGSDKVVGPVSAAGAGLSGLPEGIPVVASGLDSAVALLASGGREPGDNILIMGTSWSLGVLSNGTQHKPVPGMLHTPHVLSGDTMTFSMTGGPYTGGTAGFWMPEMVAKSSFAKLEREAKMVPIGAGGVTFLPYLMGDRTLLGQDGATGAFLGLRADHNRSHLFTAVLEGGVMLHEECMEDAARMGVELKTTRVVDGAYRSAMWRSMVADMTGRPIMYHPDFPGISYGDAMLAAYATGMVTDDTIFKWVPPARTIEPTEDDESKKAYARARARYRRYKEILADK
jgi:sugar (pentulose or hexulose) kinase